MTVFLFVCSIVLLMVGHGLRLMRWSGFIKIYEYPPAGALLRSMALGYALNFFMPFKLGDVFRAYYSGKRMKNGIGFSLATVILDRFLDLIVAALLFAVLAFSNVGRDAARESARFYYIAAAAVLALLLIATLFSSSIKRVTLKLCSVFNDHIKLKSERFFWTLINTFRDIRRVNFAAILAETIGMWVFYIGSYALFAAFMQRLGSDYALQSRSQCADSRRIELGCAEGAALARGIYAAAVGDNVCRDTHQSIYNGRKADIFRGRRISKDPPAA